MPLRLSRRSRPGVHAGAQVRDRVPVKNFGALVRPHRSARRRAGGRGRGSLIAAAGRKLGRHRRARRRRPRPSARTLRRAGRRSAGAHQRGRRRRAAGADRDPGRGRRGRARALDRGHRAHAPNGPRLPPGAAGGADAGGLGRRRAGDAPQRGRGAILPPHHPRPRRDPHGCVRGRRASACQVEVARADRARVGGADGGDPGTSSRCRPPPGWW